MASYVGISAFGEWHEEVPEGQVGVIATLGGKRCFDANQKKVLVDKNRYQNRGPHGYVIDESVDKPWNPVFL